MVNCISCFPGQGAQFTGMGLDLYEAYAEVKELFTLAGDISGLDVHRLLSEGTMEEITETENAQVLITLVNRSALSVLSSKGVKPAAAAGFSLGELTAYAAASVIGDEDLFRLVTRRGALMARYGKEIQQSLGSVSMAAVIGLGFEEVSAFVAESGIEHLYAANDNGPAQVVISGLASSLEAAQPLLKEKGAKRIIPLKVSGPFHTPLMEEARQEFLRELDAVPFRDPAIALYSNVTGEKVESGEKMKDLCSLQIVSPVRWTRIMSDLELSFPDLNVVESGPNKVLSGLFRGVGRKCLQAGTVSEIESLVEEN